MADLSAPDPLTAVWEQRRSARADLRCRVQVTVTVHEDMDDVRLARGSARGELTDISTSGAGLEMDTFLPKGTRVRTEWPRRVLAVEGEEDPDARMEVCAEVAYARGGPDRFRAGLIFLGLPETDRKRIETFVNSVERRRHPRVPVP